MLNCFIQMRPRLAASLMHMGIDPSRMEMDGAMPFGGGMMGDGSGGGGFGSSAPSSLAPPFASAGMKRVAKMSAQSPDAVTVDSLNVDLNSELDNGLSGPVLSKITAQRELKRAKFVQELVLSTLI
jgi:hypothetical protein